MTIVAEMTGYPADLLDLDLDLEADLGVDTVKQAEVFAAVRDKFNVERDENLQLRDFPTLTHVIGWVRDKTGIQPTAAAPAASAAAGHRRRPRQPAPAPRAARCPRADEVTDAVVTIVAEMTGYPAELLDLDLDLEADLGVDTVKQAEVFAAVRDKFDVERDENLQLRDFPTLTHVIGWVRDKTGIQPTTAAPAAGELPLQPRSHRQRRQPPRPPRRSSATSRPSTPCRGGSRSRPCAPTWAPAPPPGSPSVRTPGSWSSSTRAASARPWSRS